MMIIIMNLRILLLNSVINTDIQRSYYSCKHCVMYYYSFDPQYCNGICGKFELCDVGRIKELCGATCDIDNKHVYCVCVYDGINLTIYDPLRFKFISIIEQIENKCKSQHLKNEIFMRIIKTRDQKLQYSSQVNVTRFDNVITNVNDYKIIEIV